MILIRRYLALFLTALLIFSQPLLAQESGEIDYQIWENVATQAERQSENIETTSEELAALRGRIVEWRGRLQAGKNVNGAEIKSVRDQIAALGPAPAEGETEDEEIADRRAQLQKNLSALQAPRLQADEAFSRAESIIRRIDEVTAERQVTELVRVSPSPLVPSNWPAALSDAGKLAQGIASEARQRTMDRDIWGEMQPKLPQVLGYLIAAVLLLTIGRRWIDGLPSRLSAHATEYSRAVVAFVASLGQIALPLIGLFLLVRAIKASALPGEWTLPFWNALPVTGMIVYSGYWLSRQLFPAQVVAYDTLWMEQKAKNSARRMVNTLAVLFGLHHLLSSAVLPLSGIYERLGDETNRVQLDVSEAAASVWHFLLIALAALALFRLGNALRRLNRSELEQQSARYRIMSFMGRLSRLVAVGTVIPGVMGMINLANGIIWPWILTLALFGVLILLKDFCADVFSMIKRGEEGAREGLIPMLIGFGLIILSLPVFLLIWGARGTDLAEMWVSFRQGVSFGGINLSPGSVLTLLIVFVIGYMMTRGLQGMFRNTILPKTKLDAGGQNAVVAGLGYVGIFLAALLAIASAGIDLSSLAIVAGALSVGIGFGLQNIVSNFVSGIILLIERPISVGDWIEAGGQQGIVQRISVRSTQVETFDKTEVIVPNSDLISQPVINWTRNSQTGRVIIPVGVAFGSDTRRVQQVLQEIIEDQPLVTVDPAPYVLFRGFGTDRLEFEIRAILSDVGAGLGVTSEVCHQIVERFAAEGIVIPFMQRDIWLRNPEALDRDAKPQVQAARPPAPQPDPRIAADTAEGGDSLPDSDGGPDDGAR
ncbi:DUF3772 domain-containing protein [Paracoccus onubensis]|uniref:Mechanosensitive ion channel family protein n=1 Tax=Paracoccus onubensis TaxID=1675788 RepID=A0A418SQA6_9RHOB|nr:DUF3772 domain-containing protein [Paracoccus onubensis]RJE83109.1 mechanosensitive ion channel family protein [Paracoccus onubensis]